MVVDKYFPFHPVVMVVLAVIYLTLSRSVQEGEESIRQSHNNYCLKINWRKISKKKCNIDQNFIGG